MNSKKQNTCFPNKDKDAFTKAFANPLSTKNEMKEALRYYREKMQEFQTFDHRLHT